VIAYPASLPGGFAFQSMGVGLHTPPGQQPPTTKLATTIRATINIVIRFIAFLLIFCGWCSKCGDVPLTKVPSLCCKGSKSSDLSRHLHFENTTIKRKLTEMVEACNPSYLIWWIEQGFSPLPVVQRQLEIFSEKIMPEFVG
jgi:hypothetical protein